MLLRPGRISTSKRASGLLDMQGSSLVGWHTVPASTAPGKGMRQEALLSLCSIVALSRLESENTIAIARCCGNLFAVLRTDLPVGLSFTTKTAFKIPIWTKLPY